MTNHAADFLCPRPGIGLPAAARALDQAGLFGKIKLTGLAPVTLMKKYILAGQAQDIWWNVKDLGYLHTMPPKR